MQRIGDRITDMPIFWLTAKGLRDSKREEPLASRLTGKTSGKSAKPSPDLSRLDESTSDISSLIDPLGTKERSCEKGDREHRTLFRE